MSWEVPETTEDVLRSTRITACEDVLRKSAEDILRITRILQKRQVVKMSI